MLYKCIVWRKGEKKESFEREQKAGKVKATTIFFLFDWLRFLYIYCPRIIIIIIAQLEIVRAAAGFTYEITAAWEEKTASWSIIRKNTWSSIHSLIRVDTETAECAFLFIQGVSQRIEKPELIRFCFLFYCLEVMLCRNCCSIFYTGCFLFRECADENRGISYKFSSFFHDSLPYGYPCESSLTFTPWSLFNLQMFVLFS